MKIVKQNHSINQNQSSLLKQTKLNSDFDKANLTGVDPSLFKQNTKSFMQNIRKKLKNFETNSILLFEGGKIQPRFDTDTAMYFFHQNPNFYYLTGINESDFTGILDFTTEEIIVFMPDADEKTRIYVRVPSLQEILDKYKIKCLYYNDIFEFIEFRKPKKIYRLNGVNSDSGLSLIPATFNPPDKYKYLTDLLDDDKLIYEIFADTRTRKNPLEIELMRYTLSKGVEGHIETIKAVKVGKLERQIENVFVNHIRNNNYCREYSYEPICGSGLNSRILHYGKNDETLVDGGLILIDMGCRIGGYCSDITSTVPINGKFTQKQKEIYDIVLKANKTIQAYIKPGIFWPTMHLLAEKVILTELQKLGLLKSEFSVDEMLKDRLGYYFMPHGLGHFIGLDVHDVGGYLSFTPPRSDLVGLKQLRTARFLEEGNTISVEPGCYFIPFLIDKAINDNNLQKYFNINKIRDEYYSFGGVRIEDIVLVTKDGSENLSKDLPRTTDEIEKLMVKI